MIHKAGKIDPLAIMRTLVLGLLGLIFVAATAEADIYTKTDNLAVSGYDPVAYFTLGAPTKGLEELSYEWQGAVWKFSSAENLEIFKSMPEVYAPQYGGHCAWATAQGKKNVAGNPKHWRIVDDKLYLNYNKSVHRKWEKNIGGFIEKADAFWMEWAGAPS